jgi:hypothetical protein
MSFLNTLRRYRQLIGTALDSVIGAERIAMREEMRALRERAGKESPKHLLPHGYKVYSQTDEDGLIREIFDRIGTTSKTFVEFGIGDGLENNTLALLFDSWKGLWIDASTEHIASIRQHWSRVISDGRLSVVESFITAENINQLISDNFLQGEIDLLSVDIDGNDWHVLDAITCVDPRVICVEYNAKFVPPLRYCMEYNPKHVWQHDDNGGVSLQFLEDGLAERGYRLVGCSISGANAFFVRQDLVGDNFLEPYTAAQHYQPARFHLIKDVSGHKPSYQTLARALK